MLRLPVHTAVTILLTYATAAPVLAEEGTGHRPLAHTVYFDLKVSSEQSQAALIRACREKLAKIEGITYFAVGRLAPELQRPVNDRDFDVALYIVFENKQAHDRYQSDPRHQELIREQQANVEKLRVFNAYLD